MSFTFNWAGVQLPQIEKQNNVKQSIVDAANWGGAARGYLVDRADKEYQDILKNYSEGAERSSNKLEALKAELARLKARNEEIRQQIGG